jgi:hypothetical protein
MFSFFLLLLVSNQVEDLRTVAQCEIASYGDHSCRVVVLGPVTRLTGMSMRVYRPGINPLPAALFEDGIADRTHGRLWELAFRFIRVMNALVDQAVSSVGTAVLKLGFHNASVDTAITSEGFLPRVRDHRVRAVNCLRPVTALRLVR